MNTKHNSLLPLPVKSSSKKSLAGKSQEDQVKLYTQQDSSLFHKNTADTLAQAPSLQDWNVSQSPPSTWDISFPRPTLKALDVVQNKEFFIIYIKLVHLKKKLRFSNSADPLRKLRAFMDLSKSPMGMIQSPTSWPQEQGISSRAIHVAPSLALQADFPSSGLASEPGFPGQY